MLGSRAAEGEWQEETAYFLMLDGLDSGIAFYFPSFDSLINVLVVFVILCAPL